MQYFTVLNMFLAFSTIISLGTNMLIVLSTIVPFGNAIVANTTPIISDPDLPFPLVPAVLISTLSNGSEVTLSGTVSEMAIQLKELDPSWGSSPADTTGDLELRAAEVMGTRYCCPVAGWEWKTVKYINIQNAAAKVKALSGYVEVAAETCHLVECYDGAGIWACVNKPGVPWDIPFSTIASYASNIAENCPPPDGYLNDDLCGQLFSTQGWNIITHGC